MFVVAVPSACYSLRFAMMEVSIVLLSRSAFFAVDHVGITSLKMVYVVRDRIVAGPRPE